jgi:hypothetical protein
MAISIADLAVSDFTVTDQGGGIHYLAPISPAAIDWLARHLRDEAIVSYILVQVVEPADLAAILDGIRSDGLTVAQ